jgi:hypothetical protein
MYVPVLGFWENLGRGGSGTPFDPEAANIAVVVISPHQENRLLIYGNNLPTWRHHVGFKFNYYINQLFIGLSTERSLA